MIVDNLRDGTLKLNEYSRAKIPCVRSHRFLTRYTPLFHSLCMSFRCLFVHRQIYLLGNKQNPIFYI